MTSDDFSAGNDGLAVLEAQAQAFSDLSRTFTHAVEQARQQADSAERRTGAMQLRLVSLESRFDQAQAQLSEIGVHASEIARLVAQSEVAPKPAAHALTSQHDDAAPEVELDPLGVLASMRFALDTSD
jgi:septation ring formation regulator EzrA